MIRHLTFSDGVELNRLNQEQLGYTIPLTSTQEKLKRLLEDTQHHYFLAFEEESIKKVAGYVHAEVYENTYAEPMFNVMALAVDKEYQHNGIGTLLMKQLEQEAKARGYSGIRLNSAEHRKEAHKFYEHIGYKADKLQKRFFKEL